MSLCANEICRMYAMSALFVVQTDHALVRTKIQMVINPAARSRITVKFQEALAERMNAVACTSSWDTTNEDLYKVAKETIGTVAVKSRDWFDENDQAISDVLAAKTNTRSRMMQKNLSKDQKRQLSKALKQAKAGAQRELRSMQDAWWSSRNASCRRHKKQQGTL